MARSPVILLVEPAPNLRERVQAHLNGLGYEVLEAPHLVAAIWQRRRGPIDILMSDMPLPALRECRNLLCEGRPPVSRLPVRASTADAIEPRHADVPHCIDGRLGLWAVASNPSPARACEYWHGTSPDEDVPDRRALDPADIKSVLSFVSIIELLDSGGELHHRFCLAGTRVVEALGYNPSGRLIAHAADAKGAALTRQLLIRAARARRPLYAASLLYGPAPFEERTGRSTERLSLPFRCGDDALRQIIVVQTFDWQSRRLTVCELVGERERTGSLVPAATTPTGDAAIAQRAAWDPLAQDDQRDSEPLAAPSASAAR